MKSAVETRYKNVPPTSREGLSSSEKHAVHLIDRASPIALVLGRTLLGVVLGWFGYHELVIPSLWTGYVVFLSPASVLSKSLVLVHGATLLVLAAGLVFGVLPRLFALAAAALMLEIVLSLTLTAGLSDLVLRDVGVMGLALMVFSAKNQSFVLSS